MVTDLVQLVWPQSAMFVFAEVTPGPVAHSLFELPEHESYQEG